MLDESTEVIASKVVHAAYTVHRALGPGLLEQVYQLCFCRELMKAAVQYRPQATLPITYDGITFEAAFRMDVLVEESIVCELKSVEYVLPVHVAQLLTYMRLSGKRLGFLINFNVPRIKVGIRRLIL